MPYTDQPSRHHSITMLTMPLREPPQWYAARRDWGGKGSRNVLEQQMPWPKRYKGTPVFSKLEALKAEPAIPSTNTRTHLEGASRTKSKEPTMGPHRISQNEQMAQWEH